SAHGGPDRPAGESPAPPWSPADAVGDPRPTGSGWSPYPGAPPGEDLGRGPGPYPGAYATAGAGYPPMSPVQGSYPVDPRSVRSRARLWPPGRTELATAAALLLGLAVLGALLAPLWVRLAPRLDFRVDQPGRALPVVPSAEEYIAADGRYVLLTLAAGLLAGLVAWRVARSRGPLVLLALAAGGLLGAVLTWRLGLRLGTGYQPADLQEVGRIVQQPLTLRARAALVVEPFAAVVVYLLAAGFAARNDLGRDEDTQEPPAPAGHQSTTAVPGPSGSEGVGNHQGPSGYERPSGYEGTEGPGGPARTEGPAGGPGTAPVPRPGAG
ncbi:MAG: hypothetical protein AVDCRST_MAG41-2720, partial [uncultured Corynebacteriales bacterium]